MTSIGALCIIFAVNIPKENTCMHYSCFHFQMRYCYNLQVCYVYLFRWTSCHFGTQRAHWFNGLYMESWLMFLFKSIFFIQMFFIFLWRDKWMVLFDSTHVLNSMLNNDNQIKVQKYLAATPNYIIWKKR